MENILIFKISFFWSLASICSIFNKPFSMDLAKQQLDLHRNGSDLCEAFEKFGIPWILSVISLSILAGCFAPEPRSWLEDVQLSNGQQIVVGRITEFVSGGDEWAANRDLAKPYARRIRFPNPIEGEAINEWHSWQQSKAGYPEHPLVLDIENGALVIISGGYFDTGCNFYRKYTYGNGVWQGSTLRGNIKPLAANLLLPGGQNHVSLEAKRHLNRVPGPKWMKNLDPALKPCNTWKVD